MNIQHYDIKNIGILIPQEISLSEDPFWDLDEDGKELEEKTTQPIKPYGRYWYNKNMHFPYGDAEKNSIYRH